MWRKLEQHGTVARWWEVAVYLRGVARFLGRDNRG